MKIYAVQMHVEPGQPELNFETIRASVKRAEACGADLVVFPEMAVSGYLIGDLWEEASFVDSCVEVGERIAELSGEVDILFGNVARDDEVGENGRPLLYNAAFYATRGEFALLVNEGKVQKRFLPKTLLPCYREFDEPRYFSDLRKLAQKNGIAIEKILKPYEREDGQKIGISICEDGWDSMYPVKPSAILGRQMGEGDILINISCSPYTQGKGSARNRTFSHHAKRAHVPLLYVNSVGTQNNGKNIYAFEGDSCLYDAEGSVAFSFASFEPAVALVQVSKGELSVRGIRAKPFPNLMAEIRAALVYMLRENLARFRVSKVVIGASGGIDSAVSAVLYSEALGPENVFLVNMPTKFNSATTRNAAKALAENLGCPYMVAPISDIVASIQTSLAACSFERNPAKMDVSGINFENLQARTRSASVLATIASVLGAAFTCNGNKSEIAVGYCTLYGDTSGIVCALGDLWKTQVYELAAEINREGEIIPQASIDIPASAELSEAQNVDEGKGDPIIYPYHDKLFSFWMERWNRNGLADSVRELEAGTLCETLGVAPEFFWKLFGSKEEAKADMELWWRRYRGIALAKRIQMPPILSVSRRAFGFDYRESQM